MLVFSSNAKFGRLYRFNTPVTGEFIQFCLVFFNTVNRNGITDRYRGTIPFAKPLSRFFMGNFFFFIFSPNKYLNVSRFVEAREQSRNIDKQRAFSQYTRTTVVGNTGSTINERLDDEKTGGSFDVFFSLFYLDSR